MATRTIFDISNEMLELDELLDTIEDDDAQKTAIEQYLKTIVEGELSDKLDNYAAYITELACRYEARKAEAMRILTRAKQDATRCDWMKECLKWFFFTHGLKTQETGRYRISLSKNGGKIPVVLSVPQDELSEEYLNVCVERKANLDLIREALESGIEVEGCALGERGSSIRIR